MSILTRIEMKAGMGVKVGMGIGTRHIFTYPSPPPYSIKKIWYYPYTYSYLINEGIPCQNGSEFRQYP